MDTSSNFTARLGHCREHKTGKLRTANCVEWLCWIPFCCQAMQDSGCLPFVRIIRLGRALTIGKGFSKITKPTERNGAYHLQFDFPSLFSADERLETGKFANGKEISAVPFRTEKEEYLWRYSTISEWNFRKITLPFDFKPKFPDFLAKW